LCREARHPGFCFVAAQPAAPSSYFREFPAFVISNEVGRRLFPASLLRSVRLRREESLFDLWSNRRVGGPSCAAVLDWLLLAVLRGYFQECYTPSVRSQHEKILKTTATRPSMESIDQDSNIGECEGDGGFWANGSVSNECGNGLWLAAYQHPYRGNLARIPGRPS
jgi:hypothetical protein